MKFDTPATTNPIDQLKVVGKPATASTASSRRPAPRRTPTSGRTCARSRLRLRRRVDHRQGPDPGDGSRPRQARAGRDHDRHGRVRRAARQRHLQHRQAAGRAADRSLPPGDRPGGGGDLRTGACRRAARSGRLRPRAGDLRPRQGLGQRGEARAHHRGCARFGGRRFRRRLRRCAGAGRRQIHDPRPGARDDGAARHHRRMARRRAHDLDREPDGRLEPKRHGQDPRHRQEQGAAGLALHRRRLRRQAVHPRRRAAGRARRTRRASARESRLAACPDGQQHRPSAGDDPAGPDRRAARRHAHRDRARELVGRSAARQARRRGPSDPHALRRREPDDGDAPRGARPSGSQRHARARRSHRAHVARGRDGRARREARDRPGGAAHPQRHAGRSRPRRPGAGEQAFLSTPARRVPAPGRRPLRLEQAQPAPGADPRRPLAGRHGRRGGVPRRTRHEIGRARSPRQPRHGDGRDRHDRHRHGQLHDHRPDGRRDDGRAAQTASSFASATRAFRSRPAPAGNGARRARPPASTRPA